MPFVIGSTCNQCNPCPIGGFDSAKATQVQCSGLCMKVWIFTISVFFFVSLSFQQFGKLFYIYLRAVRSLNKINQYIELEWWFVSYELESQTKRESMGKGFCYRFKPASHDDCLTKNRLRESLTEQPRSFEAVRLTTNRRPRPRQMRDVHRLSELVIFSYVLKGL